jgi:hypothetical protein
MGLGIERRDRFAKAELARHARSGDRMSVVTKAHRFGPTSGGDYISGFELLVAFENYAGDAAVFHGQPLHAAAKLQLAAK